MSQEHAAGADRASGQGTDSPDVAALTGAVARGDAEAFGILYDLWFDRLLALVRSITRRDESFCLDVVQDTMLRVARSLRRLEDRAALERWLGRTAYTVALDHLRRERRRQRREERAAGRPVSASHHQVREDRLELDERIEWLGRELAALTRLERELLRQRYGLDRTLRQTGEALGLSEDAVHGRLRRALLKLRARARDIFGTVM